MTLIVEFEGEGFSATVTVHVGEGVARGRCLGHLEYLLKYFLIASTTLQIYGHRVDDVGVRNLQTVTGDSIAEAASVKTRC